MPTPEWLAEQFEEHRAHLRAVAYRTLGSASEAEDAVQESWIRLDSFLDSESDRRFEPPGRLSLGPLAPGAYVIELHGAGGRRTERIRIVDRDVYATFR